MAFAPIFPRPLHPPFGPGLSAGGNWWLSGNISAASCLAAYQPKNAASYAASKTNLNSPGSADATDGTAFPVWNATAGWSFVATSSQYLNAGFTYGSAYSLIVRYNSVTLTNGALVGYATDARVLLMENYSSGLLQPAFFLNGFYLSGLSANGLGTLAYAGKRAYKNGNYLGTISGGAQSAVAIRIGHGNNSYYLTGTIVALAAYNTILSDAQVLAVHTAMLAL